LIKYRREIDGLRAIAVVSVLFYHAQIDFFGRVFLGGGFVGVDIFFVISGYLISGVILKDLSGEGFSFSRFYERRARRILPALYVMMFATIPFAYLWLYPKAIKNASYGIMTSLLFGSNFLFWAQDGYLGEANNYRPFLHTWSLSVEEQFYLILPVIMILIWKYCRRYMTILMGILLLLSLQTAQSTDVNSFLLPQTRMWELLAGFMLAKLEWSRGRPQNPSVHFEMAMSWLGLVVIIGSVFLFKTSLNHPGYVTLLPVVGTMLIIWFSGAAQGAGKFLSHRVVVGVGLISYSLYLWHQPIFAFARRRSEEELDTVKALVLIAVCFPLAYLTWRFVEQPFRDKNRVSTRFLWSFCLACTVILFGFGAVVHFTNGLAGRYPPAIAKLSLIESHLGAYELNKIGCANQGAAVECYPVGSGPSWYLIGDSVMSALAKPLWDRLQPHDIKLFEFTRWHCWYSPRFFSEQAEWCQENNQKIQARILKEPPGVVVIMSLLQWYLEGTNFSDGEGNNVGGPVGPLLDAVTREPVPMAKMQIEVAARIEELLKYGHKVIIVYPVPELAVDIVPSTVGKILKMNISEVGSFLKDGGITTSYEVFQRRTKSSYEAYDLVPDGPNLIRIYPAEGVFCNKLVPGRCVTANEQDLLYFDQRHPTLAGAELIVDQLMEKVPADWLRRPRP
jgi:peptidoglycan/LPS O-acetylase OafA/YrhL